MSAQFSPELIELSEQMIAAEDALRAAAQLDARNPLARVQYEIALTEAAAARNAFKAQMDRDIESSKVRT